MTEIIEKVYLATVEIICTTLFNALLNSAAKPHQVEEAERNFRTGLMRAQKIKTRALELVKELP